MITQNEEADISVARWLACDHEQLEQLFRAVMASLRGGDPEQVRRRWLELDHALERHLHVEEEVLLPSFERAFPHCASRLRREHRELRAALLVLGVDLDLHELCAASATHFITMFRAHAGYEDAVLYPWAEQHLSLTERYSVISHLRHLRPTAPHGPPVARVATSNLESMARAELVPAY